MYKISKADVHYSIGHANSRCGKSFDGDKGYCRFFIPPLSPVTELGQCQKVAGAINKVYWCKLWERARAK